MKMDLGLCVIWNVLIFIILVGLCYGEEFCDQEKFTANCGPGEVVKMTTAKYGILTINKCIDKDFGSLGCNTDAMGFADSRCSGLRNCSFHVSELHKLPSNCPSALVRHLIATYQCIKVHSCKSTPPCTRPSNKNLKLDKSGIISNYGPEDGCGGCSWTLKSKPGQMINFTLYTFGRLDTDINIGVGGTCFGDTALIKSSSLTNSKKLNLCENRPRNEKFQIQGGKDVEVKLLKLTNRELGERLLLKYEVVGCPDKISNPPGTELVRKGITLAVSCVGSTRAWHLTCDGTAWIGKVGTCGSSGIDDNDVSDKGYTFHHVTSSPSGMLIVVGIGLGIGVILGMCLLAVVFLYMKRKRQQPYEYPTTATPTSLHEQGTYCPYVEKPVLIQESEYQCFHTRQTKCPHKRPDMKGFRPIPEGETVEDVFTEHQDETVHVNEAPTMRPFLYEKTLIDNKDCKILRQ